MKRKYYVLWTYIANYSSVLEVEATSPSQALDVATGFFSKDFHAKASVYVFDHEPVLIRLPATYEPTNGHDSESNRITLVAAEEMIPITPAMNESSPKAMNEVEVSL